jgi:predicted nuclease with TOPRIM domain
MPSRRSISLRKQRSRQFKALMAVGGLALGGVIGVAVKRKVDTVLKTNADIEKKMDDTLANLKQLMARYKTNQKKVVIDVTAESSELEKDNGRLQQSIKELKTQLDELKRNNAAQLQANTDMQSRLQTLSNMIQSDRNEQATLLTELQQEIKNEKQAYEDKIKQLTAENTKLKEMLREKEKDDEDEEEAD